MLSRPTMHGVDALVCNLVECLKKVARGMEQGGAILRSSKELRYSFFNGK